MSALLRLDRLVLDAVQLRGPLAKLESIAAYVDDRMWVWSMRSIEAALDRLENWHLILGTYAVMPEPRERLYSGAIRDFPYDQKFIFLTYSTDDGQKHPVGLYTSKAMAWLVVDAGTRSGLKQSFYTLHTVDQRDYAFQHYLPILGLDGSEIYRRNLMLSLKVPETVA